MPKAPFERSCREAVEDCLAAISITRLSKEGIDNIFNTPINWEFIAVLKSAM